MTTAPHLERCLHCGELAVYIASETALNPAIPLRLWSVWCKGCEIGTSWFRDKGAAGAAWNRHPIKEPGNEPGSGQCASRGMSAL